MVDTSSRRRVKLYILNAERAWDDRGTGHVSSTFSEKVRGLSLQVRSEENAPNEASFKNESEVKEKERELSGALLMESKIHPHTAYQKQQDTLIVWSEQDNDYALSFQEKAGCDEIWEKICHVQGCNPSSCITQEVVMEQETGDEMNMDDEHGFDDMNDPSHIQGNTAPIELPPCDLCKLDEISELFSNFVHLPVHTNRLAEAIELEGYIKKLLDLFHMCEDLEHMEGLHHLFEIFNNIFKLNRNTLFEKMFSEDMIFDVIGVLEYNPTKSGNRVKHREFLKKHAKFKEVIPLNNPELVQRIHQTFRIQYIQDVILPTPSVFEETMLSTLSNYICSRKAEIVNIIQGDKQFLQTLFAQIVDDELDDEKRKDLVLFLKEFCVYFSQTLQPNNKENFCKTLLGMGVLGALEIVLGLDDNQMKNAALDIFSYILDGNPSMVREFIIQEAQQQDDEDLLINLVIEQMISDTDPELGGAVQLMGIIRLLVDPENMLGATNKTEKTEFLGFFYKHSMHVLTAPLFANTVESQPSKDDYQTAQLLSIILELLTFCIDHHSYHVRNYILQKDLIRRVLVLLKSKHAFLALSSLRLVRRVVGLKDDFYNRYIVKGDLFSPIVTAFKANGDKYNLLNSAMIELFEFIKTDDIQTLISYFVETHHKEFESISYVQTFKDLKNRYDQYKNSDSAEKPTLDRWVYSNSNAAILRSNRLRRDARSMEEDEEMWFDQEDEFDDTDSIMPMADMLKTRVESTDFEQIQFDRINKYLECNRFLTAKENSVKVTTTPRLQPMGANTINININRSPPSSPAITPESTPASSPVNSPANSPNQTKNNNSNSNTNSAAAENTETSSTNTVATKKPGLVGLVDYPDEDSDEEDEDSAFPSPKRQRLST